jgi:hypothetical protein
LVLPGRELLLHFAIFAGSSKTEYRVNSSRFGDLTPC